MKKFKRKVSTLKRFPIKTIVKLNKTPIIMVEKERNKKKPPKPPKKHLNKEQTTQACFHYIFMYFLKHNQDLLKEK